MVLAALVGIGTAHERQAPRSRLAETPLGTRVLLLAWIAGVAWFGSRTWRGFLCEALMPIGAYKAAQIVTEPLWQRRAHRRRWFNDETSRVTRSPD